MNKLAILVPALIFSIHMQAQDKKGFLDIANVQDSVMHVAYEKKDVPLYLKSLNDVLAAFDKLSGQDREDYKGVVEGDYYNLSCIYALVGDKQHALDYLEKSKYYDYGHLQEDHDMDTLRHEERFKKFLSEAKRQQDEYRGTAFKTPYKSNLPDEEKVAGLSLLWAQARDNFVYFDHLDLDWNQSYMDYLTKVKATTSTAEYYKVLQTFYAQLKDGHTNVYPPAELRSEFYSRPPIWTELTEGRVFIAEVYSDTLKKMGILPGTELLKIDSMPVVAYADKYVKPYQSSSTPQDMEVREFSYALLSGPGQKPILMELKDPKGKIFTRTVPRTGYHDVNRMGSKMWKPISYEVIGNVGCLTVNNFEDEDIDKQFDAMFDTISKTKGLIIDIRNNGGGSSDIGYHIISKLTDKPFKTSACKRLKHISSPDATIRWEVLDPDYVQPDGKQYYSKPVIVLIGPQTFSAAEDFTVAFDYMKRGKLVGRPTGGSTGQPIFFNLPGGGSARVCGKRDTYPDGKEFVGIGVKPDVIVVPTVKDILNGTDAAKNKALEILSLKK